MDIKFLKVRDVETPRRAHQNDAGIDFFLPNFKDDKPSGLKDNLFMPVLRIDSGIETKDEFHLIIKPGERVLIPSGIKAILPEKKAALIAFNKSGLASNRGIIVTAQVVDADYTGEIHVGLINTSTETQSFKPGDKIGQFLYVPLYLPKMVEIDEKEFKELSQGSDRGDGGFGSTDKK